MPGAIRTCLNQLPSTVPQPSTNASRLRFGKGALDRVHDARAPATRQQRDELFANADMIPALLSFSWSLVFFFRGSISPEEAAACGESEPNGCGRFQEPRIYESLILRESVASPESCGQL